MRKTILTVLIVVCVAAAIAAEDWPQWRGPRRDGTLSAADAPLEWPSGYSRTWKVDVGEGYAGPVLAGGRVFVHSRIDPDEVVTAIDLETGATAWRQTYAAPFTKNSYAVAMAKGPNATPLLAGGRLFTFGTKGLLIAWDAASGRRLWSKDFSTLVDTTKLFCGTAASPILAGGLVVVQVGSDVRGGLTAALDPATGNVRWERPGDGPGYASPILIRSGASEQLVTMTNRSVIGLDARSGAPLWTTPFADDWHENIVTPTWTGTEIVVSGPRQGTHAFRLTESAGVWRATEVWKNTDITMYMSSPVYGDGLIYGFSSKRKGQFVALDARTGVVKWATEGREGEHASALLAPRHVVFLTNGGSLVIAKRATAAFEVEKKYEVADSATWAGPVLLGRDLLVRDATSLIKLGAK